MELKQEKRAQERTNITHLRLKATLAIILEKETIGDTVILKDFSNSGVCVYFRLEVPQNTPVRISLMDLGYHPLEGKIVWCQSTEGDLHAPPGHAFRLGLEFSQGNDTNTLAVIEHLRKLTTQV